MELREPLKTGAMLAAEYRIDQVLGAGGFGITYLAEDVRLKMPVAIKEYFPADFALRDATHSVRARSGELGDTFRWGLDSFLREAQMLARFDHPAITRVLRVIEANNTAYMVLRYEEGLPLKQYMSGLGRLMTEAEIRRMVYPILDALEIVHSRNVLHRDISPDNIIVRPDGRGVLIDFGAARTAIADKSQALTGIVREGYSPPEQFGGGGRQGPWTDIYALGAVLYHIVTGDKPPTSVHRLLEDQLVPAAEAAAGRYGDNLLTAIDKAMHLRQTDRPQSLNEFRRLLTGHSAPPLIVPPPILSPGNAGPPHPGPAPAPAGVVPLVGQPPPPKPLATPAQPATAKPPVAQPPAAPTAAEPPVVYTPPPIRADAGRVEPAAPRTLPPVVGSPPVVAPPLAGYAGNPAVTTAPVRISMGKLLFSFSGRINRAKVWLGFLMALLVVLVGVVGVLGLSIAAGEIDKRDFGPVTWTGFGALMLLAYWMSFAIYVKRAHDRGWSGWFTLLLLVPLLSLWPLIELIFLTGDPGENRFGNNPLGNTAPYSPHLAPA